MLHRLDAALNAFATRLPIRLTVYLSLALIAAWPALMQSGEMNTFHDAQFLSAYERHARIAVLRFGQLPLWDPFSCGGIYGLAAPQTRYASPFGLLSLLLGVDRGAALIAVLLPVLGMEGMFRYARLWGARARSAFAAAPLFPLCGFFGFSWHFGWVHFFSFCLVPFVLAALHRALRGDRSAALSCAVWVAIAVGFGGTYTLPMLVLPGLVECVAALVPRRHLEPVGARLSRVGVGVASTALLVAGVAAYRLWPLLESAGATLRTIGGLPQHDFAWVWRALFVPLTRSDDPDGYFYLAPWALLAALPSLSRRKTWPLWLLAGLSLWLSLGHVSAHAPFALLRKLPIYEALRAPGRYLLIFVLLMALLAGLGHSRWVARCRLRFGAGTARGMSLALGMALFTASCAATLVGRDQFAAVSTEPVPAVANDVSFRQSRGNRWLMSHFAAEGMGSLGCGEAYPVPMSQRLRGDLPAEEYLRTLDGAEALDSGEVTRVAWSPNALALRVVAPSQALLAVNQNYHPGWRSDVGEVRSLDGLLAVEVPPGEHEVHLRFLPRSGVGGLAVTLVSLLAGWLYARSHRARPGLRALSLTAGPLCGVLLLLLWPEPAYTRPAPRDAELAPIYVDTPPASAARLGVRFDVPLRLEAAALPQSPLPAASRELAMALYLRRTGPLGPAHALFVHVRGPKGKRIGADHAALSGVTYLPRMPLGQLVRDRFRVPLPAHATGEWTVQVGLYDAFGDGKRRAVREHPPGVPVHEGAVTIGHFEVQSSHPATSVPSSAPEPAAEERRP